MKCIVFTVSSLTFLRSIVLFQNCNSISKREAVSADPAQGLLTYGPIRIEVPDRSQSSKLLFLYQSLHSACCSCSISSFLLMRNVSLHSL